MPKKKMGRPKVSQKKRQMSVAFDPEQHDQITKLTELTGKSFAKIVSEGGDLIVKHYRQKGFDV